jgi:hypothetical protein
MKDHDVPGQFGSVLESDGGCAVRIIRIDLVNNCSTVKLTRYLTGF